MVSLALVISIPQTPTNHKDKYQPHCYQSVAKKTQLFKILHNLVLIYLSPFVCCHGPTELYWVYLFTLLSLWWAKLLEGKQYSFIRLCIMNLTYNMCHIKEFKTECG